MIKTDIHLLDQRCRLRRCRKQHIGKLIEFAAPAIASVEHRLAALQRVHQQPEGAENGLFADIFGGHLKHDTGGFQIACQHPYDYLRRRLVKSRWKHLFGLDV